MYFPNLPTEIGTLQGLTNLNVAGNSLAQLPTEIGSLQNLRLLGLKGNHLATLPTQIGQLTALEALVTDRTPFLSLSLNNDTT